MTGGNLHGTGWKVLNVVSPIVVLVASGCVLLAMSRVDDIGLRATTNAVEIIELKEFAAATAANRFTTADALVFSKEHREIWQAISNIKERVAYNEPPEWLVDRLYLLEAAVTDLSKEISALRVEITRGP